MHCYSSTMLILSIVGTTFSTYVMVALSYGALRVFAGEKVTVGECFKAANRRLGSIASFGVIGGSVGFVLQLLEERLSLFGKIAIWLVGAA